MNHSTLIKKLQSSLVKMRWNKSIFELNLKVPRILSSRKHTSYGGEELVSMVCSFKPEPRVFRRDIQCYLLGKSHACGVAAKMPPLHPVHVYKFLVSSTRYPFSRLMLNILVMQIALRVKIYSQIVISDLLLAN